MASMPWVHWSSFVINLYMTKYAAAFLNDSDAPFEMDEHMGFGGDCSD